MSSLKPVTDRKPNETQPNYIWLGCLLLFGLFFLWFIFGERSYSRSYRQVRKGMTQDKVVAIMGYPNRTTHLGSRLVYNWIDSYSTGRKRHKTHHRVLYTVWFKRGRVEGKRIGRKN